MKKNFILIFTILILTNTCIAKDTKDGMYYKRQIQNQRYLYSNAGIVKAIKEGNNEILSLYMNAGFDANSSYGKTPFIFFAILYNQQECVNTLLKFGANPESTIPPLFVTTTSETALTYAIKKKNSEIVKSLIKYKVDVNRNYKKQVPINIAIYKKQTKIVDILLKTGAIPNDKTIQLVNKSNDEYLKDLFINYQ